jgi:hypothetical protein
VGILHDILPTSWQRPRSAVRRRRAWIGFPTLPPSTRSATLVGMPSSLRQWSWREFAVGALVGVVVLSMLGFLLKLTMFVLFVLVVVAVAFAILSGTGLLPKLRRFW